MSPPARIVRSRTFGRDRTGHPVACARWYFGRVAVPCSERTGEAERGGEVHTPKPVVELLVEMIEPLEGRLYEPCYGTGPFFVSSEKFIDRHAGRRDMLA